MLAANGVHERSFEMVGGGSMSAAGMFQVAQPPGIDLSAQAFALAHEIGQRQDDLAEINWPPAPTFEEWFEYEGEDVVHIEHDETRTEQQAWSEDIWTPAFYAIEGASALLQGAAAAVASFVPGLAFPEFVPFSRVPGWKEYDREQWRPGVYAGPDVPFELTRVSQYIVSSVQRLFEIQGFMDEMLFAHEGLAVYNFLDEATGGETALRGTGTIGTSVVSNPEGRFFAEGPTGGPTDFALWRGSHTLLGAHLASAVAALAEESIAARLLALMDAPTIIANGVFVPFRRGSQTVARDKFYAEHGNVPGKGGKRKANTKPSTDRLHHYGGGRWAWWRDIITTDQGIVGLKSQDFTSEHSARVAYYARPPQIYWQRRDS